MVYLRCTGYKASYEAKRHKSERHRLDKGSVQIFVTSYGLMLSRIHYLCFHEYCRLVDCQADPTESVRLRLVNGNSPCAGRVEVHYKGNWRNVYGSSWDLPDAAVVCRELGCGAAVRAPSGAHFGQGSGPIVTLDVRCSGSEAALRECKSEPWTDYPVPHSNDAGVICEGRLVDCQADPTESVRLRLVNGNSPCAGRVEVHYKGNWRNVYGSSWDLPDAAVVCRELGCGAAVRAPSGAHFGQGSGPIVTLDVRCSGSEAALRECKSEPWTDYPVPHSNDAGVICEDHRVPRLVPKDDQCSGRLEVLSVETWGTVCDLDWDMDDADVVCSQLHCGVAVSVPRGAYFGKGTGLVLNDVFECKGNETILGDCPRSFGTLHCNHTSDVSVICSGNHGPRLVGGNDRCSGRVEVLHGDEWGTVCDQYFSLLDAGVVCEQLQCGAVKATPGGAYFGQGSGPVWKENYHCRGNESRLADCPVLPRDQMSCSHSNDAGLICSDESWSLRLINGTSRCDGRVEVYHNGRWVRVQDSAWNINDSNVVCRELGCGYAIFAYNSSSYGEGELPAWVNNVQCEGNESQLRKCNTFTLNPISNDSTGVGVLCSGEYCREDST
ncbi:scavenger receptor cysteine-rich domain-containing protein DMBT1-like [Rhinoraja longicauda]